MLSLMKCLVFEIISTMFKHKNVFTCHTVLIFLIYALLSSGRWLIWWFFYHCCSLKKSLLIWLKKFHRCGKTVFSFELKYWILYWAIMQGFLLYVCNNNGITKSFFLLFIVIKKILENLFANDSKRLKDLSFFSFFIFAVTLNYRDVFGKVFWNRMIKKSFMGKKKFWYF